MSLREVRKDPVQVRDDRVKVKTRFSRERPNHRLELSASWVATLRHIPFRIPFPQATFQTYTCLPVPLSQEFSDTGLVIHSRSIYYQVS